MAFDEKLAARIRSYLGKQTGLRRFFMTTTQRRTLYLLLSGLVLSVGTPLYIGLTHPERAVYFLHPMIFALQAFPYLLAAGLWLPWSSPRAGAVAHKLAGVLFLAAVLLYVAMITGLWSTGGDMVGLGFILIAIVTTSCLLVVSLVAFGLLWAGRARRASAGDPPHHRLGVRRAGHVRAGAAPAERRT